MKKHILLLAILVTSLSFGQNTFPATGNVGIGTATPAVKLVITGVPDDQSQTGGLNIETNNGTKLKIGGNSTYSWIQSHNLKPLYINELGNNTILNLSGGNVGIGTATPAVKLSVTRVPDDQSQTGGLNIETNNGTKLKIGGNSTYSWIQSHNSKPLYINELGNNTILNLSGGNVGIGTTTPDVKFTVNGNAKIKENLFITGASGGYAAGDNPILYFGVNSDFAKISVPYADKMIFSSYHGYTFNTSNNGATPVPALTISVTGNLGIGTTTPDEKLTVKGQIHTQEVKVDMLGPLVPDYVFATDYNLKTLKEVETYINKNNHLPEIQSAKEFEKNGVLLAEMNMKLLQKIEELTLYAIEQEKKTEKLTIDLIEQSKIILEQNKRIEKLEKQ